MGIPTRHTVSGAVNKNTPEHYLTHPVFGKYLEVVSEDAKPFVPELHKPTTVEEKNARTETKKAAEADADAAAKKSGKD